MKTRQWLLQFYLVWGALGICLLIAACGAPGVGKEVEVSLNGELYADSGAAIIDDQVMVSLGFLEQAFGVETEWKEEAAAEKGMGDSALSAYYYSDRVAVLMYHHLQVEPVHERILSVEQFARQMSLLQSEGFNVIGWEQYRAFMLEDARVPDNAVLLTFDDGYASFFEQAYPILQKYRYPAVNFVIVSDIDKPDEYAYPKLTWDQMREMQASGIAFLNHTYDLHRNGEVDAAGKQQPLATALLYLKRESRQETTEEYKRRVKADLALAEQRLAEELGNTSGAVAYPFGAFDGKLLEVLDELDIALSFTVTPGLNGRNDRVGRRLDAGSSDREPEDMIGALKTADKNYTDSDGNRGTMAITIDGVPATFSKVLEGSLESGPLVPLREFSQFRDVGIEWQPELRRIVLTREP